jgi:phosphoglycerol transferase MdoB-like AlkP superfamily enzyme
MLLIISFTYSFNFDIKDISALSKGIFFDRFIDEFTITSLLLLFLFINKNRISNFFAVLIFFFYITLGITQLVTYLISGELLSNLALSNVEFIGFLFTSNNVKIITISIIALIFLPALLSYIMIKNNALVKFINSKFFAIILLLLLIVSHYNTKVINKETIEQRNTLLLKNNFSHTAPIQAFVNLFKKEKKEKLYFTKDEVKLLKESHFPFNPITKFPLLKEEVYKDPLPFTHSKEKPNIILIFTEGYSARTNSVYSDKYANLTPNLKQFTEDKNTMVVKQFYNHTAATYRGLHGQFCSLFPLFGGGDMWFENDYINLSTITYKCLPHILQNNGYETIYLNMHYKDESANDDMVSHFGFDSILSGEELSNRYLNGINHIKSNYLSDHQSYDALTAYLKEKENHSDEPFFLATYTIETHAFLDIGSDGIPYKDGENNVLNTIHNMDHAFGKFWNYFKNSKFSKNTLIVFTSDHAHYFEKEYIDTMKTYHEDDYHQAFIDKVPLLIYAPTITLPQTWDAHQATSIDLAPTLLHLLSIRNESNAFLGTSLFDKNRKKFGISSYGENFYMIKKNHSIYLEQNVLPQDSKIFNTINKFIKYTQELEKENRIYPHK